MARYDLYGIGNALVDLEFEVPDAMLAALDVDKGLMTLIEEERHHELLGRLDGVAPRPCGGGSAANTVVAAAQLGARTFYSCKVADDGEGRFYLDDLAANGVATNLAAGALETGHTGKCIVLITPDAERSMSTFLGITRELDAGALDEEAVAAASQLYIEGYLVAEPGARAAAVRARELADAAGVTTSLTLSDVNMVRHFREGLLEIVGAGLDLVFGNEEEVRLMVGAEDIDEAIEGMQRLARRFAITRGARGSLLWDGERVTEVPTETVVPLDATGAGDVYAGAFLRALSLGLPFTRAAELANAAATTLVTRLGARLAAEEMRAVGRRFGI